MQKKEVKNCKNAFRTTKRKNEKLIKEKQFFKIKTVFKKNRIEF